jgi:DNA-binding NtrC family response regulator
MVQGFAEQSGGAVHISSVLGTGTKVELRLPAAESVEHFDKQHPLDEALQGSGCVLLVDDAADVLATLGALLERAGFQVRLAASAENALAILSAGERFSALVTDYAMPGMNGVTLIEQARTIQSELAALLITGFADADREEMLPESIAVLHKPVSRVQLVEAVLRLIQQEPGPRMIR